MTDGKIEQLHREATKETESLMKPKKTNRYFIPVATITFALASLLLIYGFYLLFWPITPLVVKSVVVDDPVVGMSLTYKINACKNVSITPVLQRKIVSTSDANNGAALLPSFGIANPGCRTTTVTVIIPQVPPGEYILYGDADYRVNLLRDIHVQWQSQPFQIKPAVDVNDGNV